MSLMAAAVGGVAAAGAGWGLSQIPMGGDKGTSGIIPPRVEMIADYPWMTDLYENAAGYYGDTFDRWGEFYGGGQMPEYIDRGSELVRKALERPLTERMYGTPGHRSGTTFAEAESLGARAGVGGKTALGPASNALAKYEADFKAIDNEIMKIVLDEGYRQTQLATQGTTQLPQGQRFATLGGMSYGTPEKKNYMGEAMGAIGENIPWESLAKGGTNTNTGGGGGYTPPSGAGMSSSQIMSNPQLYGVATSVRR